MNAPTQSEPVARPYVSFVLPCFNEGAVMISWVGFKQSPLLYDRDKRFAGETKYPLGRLVRLAMDGIIASSTRLLKLASCAGVILGLASLLLILYALYSWLFIGRTPQGWTSMMIVVTFTGSTQLLVLGIMGQYLGRIHEQLKGRPLFIVQNVHRKSDLARTGGP